MLSFKFWKGLITILSCILGLIYFIPNVVDNKFASFFPDKSINYGLDLRGGSQLLLKIDFDKYLQDQFLTNSSLLKRELRRNKIGFSNFVSNTSSIRFNLIQAENNKNLSKIIKNLNRDYKLNVHENRAEIYFTNDSLEKIRDTLIEQSREIIRLRIDESGTLDPSIQRQGKQNILLQVPGLTDPKKIKSLLGTTAKLSFHIVHDIQEYNNSRLAPVGYKQVPNITKNLYYIVKNSSLLTGDLLNNASSSIQNGMHVVSFEFNKVGARIFGELTKKNPGKQLAIVIDDKIISAPAINEPIMGGNGVIQGNFTAQSASELALLLRAGALPAPLKIIEERTVGPTLGQDSITKGKEASIYAIVAVVILMIALYGLYGIFASIALAFNLVFLIAAITILQATLTLPGIAGVVLTMGMAVDANVLIFERIKEELESSNSTKYSVNRGFDKAYSTIIDSNITTLIAAFFLYIFGTGVVKSFAVTLTIGITASMFTAITLTKYMITTWYKAKN
ncbi:MAG: protein translocase subunit SecD [Rickettsiales bacterium]